MKRTLTKLCVFALIFSGFLFVTSSAQAASIRTESKNGVTCEQWPTNYNPGVYPQTYWVCTATHANPTVSEKLVGGLARTMPAGIQNTLTAGNVEIMVFQSAADFTLFTGTAVPDTKYMAWTAPSGPGYLANKKIAAVFAQANLYNAIDHVVATRNMTASYGTNILQALGRQYDQLTGNPSQIGGNPIHLFPITVDYDSYWTNHNQDSTNTTVTQVWDAFIAALYPNDDPWGVLGKLYGNTNADLYAFEFSRQYGNPYSHLDQFMNTYTKNATAFRKQQVFGVGPVLTVKGAYGVNGDANVLCVLHTNTGLNAPANKIWDCVHPYNYTAGEHQAGTNVSQLPVTFRNNLNAYNPSLEFYVMFSSKDYNTMFGTNLGAGIIGYSNNGSERAAAFYESQSVFPGIVYNYYGGTLAHEVGHMLNDQNWGGYSANPNNAWKNIVLADIAQFNNLTCMAALNDATACSNVGDYANKTNWNRFLVRMGMYYQNPTPEQEAHIYNEMFAYMFQKKSGGTTFPFLQYVEGQFWALPVPNMKNKMDSIWNNGQP